MSMILPLVLFVLITKRIFGKRGRILLIVTITILLTSITAITVYKSSWQYSSESTTFEVITKAMGRNTRIYFIYKTGGNWFGSY